MAKSRLVVKSIYEPITNVLTKIEGGIKDVIKSGTIEEATSILVARELSSTIKDKYHTYLDDIADYEHNKSDVQISITDTKKGWVVHVSGDDLLYHEYGTGSRGLKKPHPTHNKDGMKPYGSGRNVIQGTYQIEVKYNTKLLKELTDKNYKPVKWVYINKNNGRRTPYWYPLYLDGVMDFPNDFNNGPLDKNEYVWRHNGRITKGLPAGKFIYDSIESIAQYDVNDNHTTLKHTITQTIPKEYVKRLEPKVTEIKNKK